MSSFNMFSVLCEENKVFRRKQKKEMSLNSSNRINQDARSNPNMATHNSSDYKWSLEDNVKWADILDDEDDTIDPLNYNINLLSGENDDTNPEQNNFFDVDEEVDDELEKSDETDLVHVTDNNSTFFSYNAKLNKKKNPLEPSDSNCSMVNCADKSSKLNAVKNLSKKERQKKEELEIEEIEGLLKTLKFVVSDKQCNTVTQSENHNSRTATTICINDPTKSSKSNSKNKSKKKKKDPGNKKADLVNPEENLTDRISDGEKQVNAILNIRKVIAFKKKTKDQLKLNGISVEALLEEKKKSVIKKEKQKKKEHFCDRW